MRDDVQSHAIIRSINVYCPECPPGGTIGHLGVDSKKKFLSFFLGRDLVAYNGTGL